MTQAQHLKQMAIDVYRTLVQKGHKFAFRVVKNKLISGRHAALTHYNVPRSINGQKLGLRKREVLAEALRVKE